MLSALPTWRVGAYLNAVVTAKGFEGKESCTTQGHQEGLGDRTLPSLILSRLLTSMQNVWGHKGT